MSSLREIELAQRYHKAQVRVSIPKVIRKYPCSAKCGAEFSGENEDHKVLSIMLRDDFQHTVKVFAHLL